VGGTVSLLRPAELCKYAYLQKLPMGIGATHTASSNHLPVGTGREQIGKRKGGRTSVFGRSGTRKKKEADRMLIRDVACSKGEK